MTTLTIEFRGVIESIIQRLIDQGYAKTKAEAVRYALLHVGEEMQLVQPRIHARAEKYMEEEIMARFAKTRRK